MRAGAIERTCTMSAIATEGRGVKLLAGILRRGGGGADGQHKLGGSFAGRHGLGGGVSA
jgi:hypothetical protein